MDEYYPYRDKAILLGLYLSRFGRDALKSFGFSTYKEAYNTFGYSVGVRPASIKNYRDEFDPYTQSGRKGWHRREIRDYCKRIMDSTQSLSLGDFHRLVRSFVTDKYVDINDLPSTQRLPGNSAALANRMVTGKAAEEYFVMNYQSIPQFQNHSLTDTTNMGCGFDYKLSMEKSNYYVEVKGINGRQGSILMTEKEHEMAESLADKFCLFVVSNFKDTPVHQMFFNPLHSGMIAFRRQERHILQVSYTANIILPSGKASAAPIMAGQM